MRPPPHLAPMTTTDHRAARPQNSIWGPLLLAVLPVAATMLIGNLATIPQIPGWYQTLVKPPFNPPSWVFGPVWTTLYALMAFGVFRIFRLPVGTPGRRRALTIYHVQLVLNALWSCVFFGMNSPLGGVIVILPLLAMILAMILAFRPLDRLAANLQFPYLAWVAFATLLTLSIWWLNR